MKLSGWFVLYICILLTPIVASSAESPDPVGEIVFAKRDGTISSIYRMRADGSNPVLVFKHTDARNSNALFPHWVDDMRRIQFAAMENGQWKTFSCTRDGQDVHIDPDAPRMEFTQSVFPDGLSVEFGDLFYTPPLKARIRLFHYVSRGADDAGDGGAQAVAWSPDHRWVIFSACLSQNSRSNNPCHIYIVTPDGKRRRDLGPGQEPDWGISIRAH
jgi:hypothetical protein